MLGQCGYACSRELAMIPTSGYSVRVPRAIPVFRSQGPRLVVQRSTCFHYTAGITWISEHSVENINEPLSSLTLRSLPSSFSE